MAYQFDFGAVFDYSGLLAQGAGFTLALTAAGAVLGGAIGVAGGVSRAWRIAPLHWLFKASLWNLKVLVNQLKSKSIILKFLVMLIRMKYKKR